VSPLPPAPEGPPMPEPPPLEPPLLSQAAIASEAIIKQTATTFFIAQSPYKNFRSPCLIGIAQSRREWRPNPCRIP
jgi:hypothetical protein